MNKRVVKLEKPLLLSFTLNYKFNIYNMLNILKTLNTCLILGGMITAHNKSLTLVLIIINKASSNEEVDEFSRIPYGQYSSAPRRMRKPNENNTKGGNSNIWVYRMYRPALRGKLHITYFQA